MQSKLHFLLLFAYFSHISLLFDSFLLFQATKRYIFQTQQTKLMVFKTKDKRDVSKQNTTLILFSITK